jgi:hypothetical protein
MATGTKNCLGMLQTRASVGFGIQTWGINIEGVVRFPKG